MNTLYDSESFVVMHMLSSLDGQEAVEQDPGKPALVRHGFEIVDKRSGKEIYLDGSWAEIFQQQIQAWQRKTPTQEEVEDTLASYTVLAQQPIVVH